MYKCPGCGGALRFDPESQHIVCDHCGSHYNPEDSGFTHANESVETQEVGVAEAQGGNVLEAHFYLCPNCGAKLLSTDDTAATFCSFCGSNVVLEERLDYEIAPDVIIPFKVSKAACEKAYRKILSRALFIPSGMKKDTQIEKFRGIYMPYWIYNYETNGPIHVEGTKSYRHGDYIYKDRYDITANVEAGYDGISYDASSGFSDAISQAVGPYEIGDSRDFKQTYISGFYADVMDVPAYVYQDNAQNVAREYVAGQVNSNIEFWRHGASYSDVHDATSVSERKNQKGYYPVWFLANRSSDGKNVSYAVVNGQTGKAAADLPVAFWKYLLGTLLLAVPLAVFFWGCAMGSTEMSVTPRALGFVMTVISVILCFVLNRGIKKAYNREHFLDDKGVMESRSAKNLFVEGTSASEPKMKRFKYLFKPILSIIVAALVFYLHPINDLYYYGAAIIEILMTILSFWDLVSLHNRQARQPLPQLNKRGGDFGA